MIGQVVKKHQLVNNMEDADLMVLNSCSFIDTARQETIATLLELKEWKTGKKYIILAGCYVEEEKEKILDLYPFLDGVINTGGIAKINTLIDNILNKTSTKYLYQSQELNFEQNDERFLATPSHFAYLKIGEGCSNHCSFCAIPYLRGPAIYKSPDAILKEAQILSDRGVKELILIAQDLARYQWGNNYTLSSLLVQLEAIIGIKWIRLLYCYPDKIDTTLINTIKASKKIVRYIDMPIQHINDTILKYMNRKSSKSIIVDTIRSLRDAMPDIKIRSTVMVGFPKETDSQFQELLDFIEQTKFDHLGVFTYSKEKNTASSSMRGHIDDSVKEKRFHKTMSLQQEISKKLNRQYIGQTLSVMVDDTNGGRRYFDAPDIDGFVYIKNIKKTDIGKVKKVKITKALEYDLLGNFI